MFARFLFFSLLWVSVSCCVFWEFCCSGMLAGLTVRKEGTCFLLIISPDIKWRKYQKRNSLELNEFWLEVQDLETQGQSERKMETWKPSYKAWLFFLACCFLSPSGCFSHCLFFWAHSLCIDPNAFKIIELALLLGKRLAMGEC